MQDQVNDSPLRTLSPEDAAVIDSLMGSLRAGSEHLKLTDAHAPASKGVDGSAHGSDAALKDASGDEPDGEQVDSTAHVDQARLDAGQRWLNRIGHWPAEDPPADLVARTMHRIDQVKQRQRFNSQIQALAGSSSQGLPMRELLTAAAVILIGLAIVWPVLEQGRREARKLTCANNLKAAGVAMGQYAQDSQQQMPRLGSWPGYDWWKVGQDQEPDGPVPSNSAHLYVLIRKGYIHPDRLNCPENVHARTGLSPKAHDWPSPDAPSFSYQNQFTAKPLRLDVRADEAVLADRNPLFVIHMTQPGHAKMVLKYRGGERQTTAPSEAHQGQGQNVLFSSGAVRFMSKPVLRDGDVLWTAHGVDHYTGNEQPADESDSFLVP